MTNNPLNTVTEAISQQFVNNWVNTDGTPKTPFCLDDNEDFVPPSPAAPWIRFTIRNTGSIQETLGQPGNRRYERKGIITGSVYTPVNAGRQLSDQLCQTFKDIFEGTSNSTVIFYTAKFVELGTDGQWYQVAVKIDFVYYETK